MGATEGFMKAQIEQLEKENKKLKLIQETNEKQIQNDIKERDEMRLQIADLMGERDGLKIAVDKLKEENQTLELWLDNKEKLNEEYRKQIDRYKRKYQNSLSVEGEPDLYEDVGDDEEGFSRDEHAYEEIRGD